MKWSISGLCVDSVRIKLSENCLLLACLSCARMWKDTYGSQSGSVNCIDRLVGVTVGDTGCDCERRWRGGRTTLESESDPSMGSLLNRTCQDCPCLRRMDDGGRRVAGVSCPALLASLACCDCCSCWRWRSSYALWYDELRSGIGAMTGEEVLLLLLGDGEVETPERFLPLFDIGGAAIASVVQAPEASRGDDRGEAR